MNSALWSLFRGRQLAPDQIDMFLNVSWVRKELRWTEWEEIRQVSFSTPRTAQLGRTWREVYGANKSLTQQVCTRSITAPSWATAPLWAAVGSVYNPNSSGLLLQDMVRAKVCTGGDEAQQGSVWGSTGTKPKPPGQCGLVPCVFYQDPEWLKKAMWTAHCCSVDTPMLNCLYTIRLLNMHPNV